MRGPAAPQLSPDNLGPWRGEAQPWPAGATSAGAAAAAAAAPSHPLVLLSSSRRQMEGWEQRASTDALFSFHRPKPFVSYPPLFVFLFLPSLPFPLPVLPQGLSEDPVLPPPAPTGQGAAKCPKQTQPKR